jgi:hypothetical protein
MMGTDRCRQIAELERFEQLEMLQPQNRGQSRPWLDE